MRGTNYKLPVAHILVLVHLTIRTNKLLRFFAEVCSKHSADPLEDFSYTGMRKKWIVHLQEVNK
jgi:hypothetical protein